MTVQEEPTRGQKVPFLDSMKLVVAKTNLTSRKISVDCDKIFEAKHKNKNMTKL